LEHGLIVTEFDANGVRTDVTRKAKFTRSAPAVVAVDAAGHCRAVGDGEAQVAVTFGDQTVEVPVNAAETGKTAVPSFKQDILPIFTKTGCNNGSCHGKLVGQNGFRLSLRGFAPEWDYAWITKEVNGRRINTAFPEASLLVEKPSGGVLHEGGPRFKPGTRYWQTLVSWIAARAPGPVADETDAASLEILPGDREMRPGETQQLLVEAHYPGGRVRDVTWLAQFFSNDETTLAVKPDGTVKALRSGEGSVRVHFQGQVAVVRMTMPFAADVANADFTRRNNPIDDAVFRKLQALHVAPSAGCRDSTFIRRAYLDTIGALPSPDEVTAFAADTRPDKRARLVDDLLARPEWVDYWTLQLADLFQNRKERDHDVRGTKGVRAFHAWLHDQLAANRPWSELARTVLLAKGDTVTHPEAGYFVTLVGENDHVEASDLPDSAAQCFLGTRIGCARCHNHPLERYTQDDFYHFAAFFSKVALKRQAPEKGPTELTTLSREEIEAQKHLDEEIAKYDEAESAAWAYGEEPGGEELHKTAAARQKRAEEVRKELETIQLRPPTVNQPRTGEKMQPRALDRAAWAGQPGGDPREQLVDWMLKSDLFSQAMVNRLWKHFFNVGLVEPVDDLRASNPPTNAELWAFLSGEFAAHNYDLKHVMRLILESRAYQLSSDTVPGNEADAKFYSHYYARRLPAEVLTDAIASATNVPAEYPGYPVGLRAVQLPDPSVNSYFLTLFGRSDRVTACACERKGEVTLPQLLHLHNGDDMQGQIQGADGRLAELLKQADDRSVMDGLFLATIAREPSQAEVNSATQLLAADKRDAVFQDLFWALLNSKEFTFNH
jgi:Protein of unknown function (DUF1549)/Protein of unknown function (DUF1553)